MLTDEIIEQIYSHESHYKYGRFGKLILYAISASILYFSVYLMVEEKQIIQAAVQTVVALGIIAEANIKRGYNAQYLEDLVKTLTEINLMLADIKDNKARVAFTKEFNYYVDLISDRPNAVSKRDLNKLIREIREQIEIDLEAERQGYHFTTEEEYEEQRRREEEAFQRRKAEERQKQKQDKENKKKEKENRKIKYFDGCYTLDELNKRKKELLKQYHPDNHRNGLEKAQCEQISKEINEAFTLAKENLTNDFTY